MAALLRAAGGHVSGRARLRGHAVGRRFAPRLHRVAARLVALPPDLRRRAGPAGAARAPRHVGRRPSQLHVALPRAASRGRDAASCSGSFPGSQPSFASRSWPGPRASRSTRSRRCGCCLTAVTLVLEGPLPAGRARSARSRCPRRCTPSSPPGSTAFRRGARPAPGLRRPRKDVPESGHRRLSRAGARPSSSRCSTSLVRKEVLGVQADPRSPEHGQYGFLQDLVRHVAYETLSHRDRKARHLAAARLLAEGLGEEEVAEVVASHYLDAYRIGPRRRRRGRDPRAGLRGPRAGGRPGRIARRGAPRRSATSSRRRSWPERRLRRPRSPTGPARWPGWRGTPSRRGRTTTTPSPDTSRKASRARRRACRPGSPRWTSSTAGPARPWPGSSRCWRRSPARRARRRPRSRPSSAAS